MELQSLFLIFSPKEETDLAIFWPQIRQQYAISLLRFFSRSFITWPIFRPNKRCNQSLALVTFASKALSNITFIFSRLLWKVQDDVKSIWHTWLLWDRSIIRALQSILTDHKINSVKFRVAYFVIHFGHIKILIIRYFTHIFTIFHQVKVKIARSSP